MEEAGWKVAIVLIGIAVGLGGFLASFIWSEVFGSHRQKFDAITARLHQMEVNTVANHLTKAEVRQELQAFAREFISPLNSQMQAFSVELRSFRGALNKARIHVDEP